MEKNRQSNQGDLQHAKDVYEKAYELTRHEATINGETMIQLVRWNTIDDAIENLSYMKGYLTKLVNSSRDKEKRVEKKYSSIRNEIDDLLAELKERQSKRDK